MTKRPAITAAGGVVFREHHGQRQVLLIHRESYDDWSLPKGKGEADELLPETAVREILEETGVTARLDLRLPTVRYEVSKGRKATHYWRASVVKQKPRKPDREVSKVRWFDIRDALAQVSYADERELIATAMAQPATTVLMVVRHGKAMLRKDWTGPDQKRRLAGRGRRQAKELADLLEVFGIRRLVSSASTRCVETLAPYAKSAGLEIERVPLLTEEEGTAHPERVAEFMAGLRAGLTEPSAICGHRPVLPAMYRGLGLDPKPMVVGEARALHLDADGGLIKTEVFKPTA